MSRKQLRHPLWPPDTDAWSLTIAGGSPVTGAHVGARSFMPAILQRKAGRCGWDFLALGKGDVVRLEDLPRQLAASAPVSVEPIGNRSLKQALEGPERQIILEVLESNHWNRHVTADTLGINLWPRHQHINAASDLGYFDSGETRANEPEPIMQARLVLANATRLVLANALAVLGLSAPERM